MLAGNLDGLKNAIEHGISPTPRMRTDALFCIGPALIIGMILPEYLIQRGAEVNKAGGTLNETPIQWASCNEGYGFTHLVALLLEKGASIDHKSTLD